MLTIQCSKCGDTFEVAALSPVVAPVADPSPAPSDVAPAETPVEPAPETQTA